MAETEERALSDLRRMIFDGTLASGERISEVTVAELLGISRTPAKLALARLEMIGLIKKRDGRGYIVREVREQDVESLLRVRGVLEGLAAWHLATKGIAQQARTRLQQSLSISQGLVRQDRMTAHQAELYQEANTLFHTTIMESCGNEFLQLSYEGIRHFPMAALGALSFDLEQPEREAMRVAIGHAQHTVIYDAIVSGDAARAEAVMREHTHATLGYARLFSGEQAESFVSEPGTRRESVTGETIQ